MSAKTIPSQWPGLALALGLGLATIIGVASLARADSVSSPAPQTAAQTASTPETPPNFVCRAQPGGWCDLRDWSGMDRWTTAPPASLSN